MKNIILYFCLLGLIYFPSMAQDQDNYSDPDQLSVTGTSTETESNQDEISLKRFDTDLTVGTSFTYSPKNFLGPSYYIAPEFSYRVTPRFILSAGVGLEYSQFYPLYSETREQDNLLPMTRAFLYARGTYLVSPRLSVSGTAYKVINDVPRLSNHLSSYNLNYQGISVGFNYKFSNSFSFGFEMQMQQNPYYRSDGLIPPAGYVSVPGF